MQSERRLLRLNNFRMKWNSNDGTQISTTLYTNTNILAFKHASILKVFLEVPGAPFFHLENALNNYVHLQSVFGVNQG